MKCPDCGCELEDGNWCPACMAWWDDALRGIYHLDKRGVDIILGAK